jgi:hypothetical protein
MQAKHSSLMCVLHLFLHACHRHRRPSSCTCCCSRPCLQLPVARQLLASTTIPYPPLCLLHHECTLAAGIVGPAAAHAVVAGHACGFLLLVSLRLLSKAVLPATHHGMRLSFCVYFGVTGGLVLAALAAYLAVIRPAVIAAMAEAEEEDAEQGDALAAMQTGMTGTTNRWAAHHMLCSACVMPIYTIDTHDGLLKFHCSTVLCWLLKRATASTGLQTCVQRQYQPVSTPWQSLTAAFCRCPTCICSAQGMLK